VNHPKTILFHRISFLDCINLSIGIMENKPCMPETVSKHIIIWLLIWFMVPGKNQFGLFMLDSKVENDP